MSQHSVTHIFPYHSRQSSLVVTHHDRIMNAGEASICISFLCIYVLRAPTSRSQRLGKKFKVVSCLTFFCLSHSFDLNKSQYPNQRYQVGCEPSFSICKFSFLSFELNCSQCGIDFRRMQIFFHSLDILFFMFKKSNVNFFSIRE